MASSGLARLIQQVATEDWISPRIDAMNGKAELERWGKPNLDIHPSSAGSACPRDIELWMLGHRTGAAPKNRRRMDNGTAAGYRWNQYFHDAGLLHMILDPVSEEWIDLANVREIQQDPFPWSGECDVILKNPDTGLLHVGELKTMNSHLWRNLPDQLADRQAMTRLLMRHVKHYVYQLTQYLVKLGPLYGTEREGFFLFENTDTQEFKILYVEPDNAVRLEAFANALEAQTAARTGELIPPPFKKASMTCRKCYREGICYSLQNGDQEPWDKVTEALSLTKVGL